MRHEIIWCTRNNLEEVQFGVALGHQGSPVFFYSIGLPPWSMGMFTGHQMSRYSRPSRTWNEMPGLAYKTLYFRGALARRTRTNIAC